MSIKKVLVTGANGQLGRCLQKLVKDSTNNSFQFLFTSFKALDITDSEKVSQTFLKEQFDYCINCAAYTNVDRAETERTEASRVNVAGVENLALSCREYGATLVHISTDFVFDGESVVPYLETDITNPIGVYGATKLKGEHKVAEILSNYFIIRTSWLYSEYGTNFMKTMLRLANENKQISIVDDQKGSPTYATDLAILILEILESQNQSFGTYHYSNHGITSWYGFANKIFEFANLKIKTKPILTSDYATSATRPKFSALDSSKIKSVFGVETNPWEESLKLALTNLDTLKE